MKLKLIKILDELHKYVPRCSDEPQKVQQVAFGGDALTAIRTRQGINVRVNSSDSVTALRGMVPFAADWHAKVNFISVSMLVSVKFPCTCIQELHEHNIFSRSCGNACISMVLAERVEP